MAMADLEGKSSSEAVTETMKKDMNNDRTTSVPSRGNKSKGKKRKRDTTSRGKKDWRQEQEKYYQRLLYTAQKDLNKQSKIVRTFECKKMIRKIKEKKATCPEQEDKSSNLLSMEESYEKMKNFDLKFAVQECLRRLGILHLDPKLDPKLQEKRENECDNDSDRNDEEKTATNNDNHNAASEDVESKRSYASGGKGSTPQQPSKHQKALVERILKHKKMQTSLENWNEQVTEYRRWCLRQEEIASGAYDYDGSSGTGGKKKNKKKGNSSEQAATNNSHPGAPGEESLFVCLGGGDNQNNADEEMPHYGPGSFEDKKKNRPGQRARKAKAMAVEAKKTGRPRQASNSVNWRPKKQQQGQDDHNGHNKPDRAAHSANRNTVTEKEVAINQEELHPSWAAKKEKKAGIVEFKGTKITF